MQKKIKLSIRGYILAVKYFLQGDSWQFAKEYALAITQWTEKAPTDEPAGAGD